MREHPIRENWDIQVLDDSTVFIRYKGVDVLSLWLPLDDSADHMVEVAHSKQFTEWVGDAERNMLDEIPPTEWGDGIAVELNGVVDRIDDAVEAVEQCRLRMETLRHLRTLEETQGDCGAIVGAFLRAHGYTKEG